MRRTKEEADKTRRQLLDAGLRVFGKKGYAATRLSDIASEAGVTRGAVYWHFGSKKGLMFAILREMTNPYMQIALTVLESDLGPCEKIRGVVCGVMDAMDRKKDFLWHEQLALRFKAEHPKEFTEYHGDVSVGTKKVTRLLRRAIRDGQSSGAIRSDVDAGIITGTVAAVLRGSALMKTMRPLSLLPRGRSQDVADLIIKGLEPR